MTTIAVMLIMFWKVLQLENYAEDKKIMMKKKKYMMMVMVMMLSVHT